MFKRGKGGYSRGDKDKTGKDSLGKGPVGPQGDAAQLAAKLDASYFVGEQDIADVALSSRLDYNHEVLKSLFSRAGDVVFRELRLHLDSAPRALIVGIEEMVSKELVGELLIRPLVDSLGKRGVTGGPGSVVDMVERELVTVAKVCVLRSFRHVVDSVLDGNAVLLIDGCLEALAADIKSPAARAIDMPDREASLRGPQEAFNENLMSNISLLRKRLKTPLLAIEINRVGHLTGTRFAITYLYGLARDDLLNEVRRRLSFLETDGVLDASYLEEFLEDDPWSPFPQIQASERPDVLASALLEGRVGIIVEGSPQSLIVPVTVWRLIQPAEDYYQRHIYASLLRILRIVAVNVALTLPAFYVSLVSFHQEMLPPALLTTIAASREGIPFPAVVEVLLMEVSFEALREAGIRLPLPVGETVSIVGALVVGLAAVQAGLVSPTIVTVVALTGIASFMMPSFSFGFGLRMLRIGVLAMAGFLGLFGLIAGLLAILVHLSTLKSFGVPYLSPVAPFTFPDMKDVIVRAPHWMMLTRPKDTTKHPGRWQVKTQAPGIGGRRRWPRPWRYWR